MAGCWCIASPATMPRPYSPPSACDGPTCTRRATGRRVRRNANLHAVRSVRRAWRPPLKSWPWNPASSRLDDADLAACTRLGDEVLTAYLRALDAAARMDAGEPPTGWTAARYCRLCGPVLLWPDCPSIVLACPWCFRRKAGRYVPRPQVQCADCVHFIRNVLNPAGGGGDCAKDRGGHWPKQIHRCAGFEPAEVATMVATGNTKKRHREESR